MQLVMSIEEAVFKDPAFKSKQKAISTSVVLVMVTLLLSSTLNLLLGSGQGEEEEEGHAAVRHAFDAERVQCMRCQPIARRAFLMVSGWGCPVLL